MSEFNSASSVPDSEFIDPAAPSDAPVNQSVPDTDTVPGSPPVPLTVWRTVRDEGPPNAIPARLAYRLIAAYTTHGQATVDLTTGHALANACTTGGRTHHPAWFTAVGSLIIGAPTQPTDRTTPPGAASDLPASRIAATEGGQSGKSAGADSEPPTIRTWFGDDLSDPDRPATVGPDPASDPEGQLTGQAAMVAASWPLAATDEGSAVRLRWLLTGALRLLTPTGCLVLILDRATGGTRPPEDFGPLIATASSAGLTYLQHLVGVEADTDGDSFVYHSSDEELLALAHTDATGRPTPGRHQHVHADLLVFSPAPRPNRRRVSSAPTGEAASAVGDPPGNQGVPGQAGTTDD